MGSRNLLGVGGPAAVAAGATYRDEVMADSPYGYWRMGDAASPLQDETAGNHDITISGATLDVTGALTAGDDGAVQFDGTNDYGSVALDLSDTAVVTIECWFWWNAYATDDDYLMEFTPNYFSSTGGFAFNWNREGPPDLPTLQLKGDVGTSTKTIARPSAAAWHHLVIVLDKSQAAGSEVFAAYVDGSAVTLTVSSSSENTNNFANSTLYLMSRNGASNFGAGKLDELAVYKSALSSGRVTAHWDARD